MDILREGVSHVLTQCGNGGPAATQSRSSRRCPLPGYVMSGECGCGKPPGPARGRGSPPGITTAIAVNRPMTTLVVMTALPPLMAFGTHPQRLALWCSALARTPPPRIVGQVALRVQRDRASKPQESQLGTSVAPAFSPRPAQLSPGASRRSRPGCVRAPDPALAEPGLAPGAAFPATRQHPGPPGRSRP
jgi:hypothetical protein